MHRSLARLAGPFVWLLALAAFAQPTPPNGAPNVLVFVADDAGARDFGAYGNAAIRTPHIDRLAEDGLKFSNAFLTIAQCSPSRISILTGRYPHQTGAEDLHMPLPEGARILPAYLADAGYFTGHMRKTHYGPHADAQFDWYDPGLDAFPAFLDARGDRPFFLWVGFSDPHRPYQLGTVDPPHDPAAVKVPPYLADTPETRMDLALYYDEISRMDARIGAFLEELDRRGLRGETLVIFFSDNGKPFPRAKGTAYDAGIKTPLVFAWPGVIEPGRVYHGLTSLIDLAPTVLDYAGVAPPETMEGRSLRPAVADTSVAGREAVFAERNWHDCDEHIRAVRTERYKLIVNAYTELPLCTAADIGGGPAFLSLRSLLEQGLLNDDQMRLFEAPRARVELYDLETDPWEFDNLADDPAYRGVARSLADRLNAWMADTDDFPPTRRRRDDHTDRITGFRFADDIPPMRDP